MKKSKKKPSLFDLKGQFLERWHTLIHLNASPHSIALGLALGIFIGLLPIMGIQMAVVLVFAYPFKKANKIAAVSGVWISNPLTVAPIYLFIYWVGSLFYSQESILSAHQFQEKFDAILQMNSFIDQTSGFIDLGADIFIPMCVGGATTGFVAAIVTYFVTLRFVTLYRIKIWHESPEKFKPHLHEAAAELSHRKKSEHPWISDELPSPGVLKGKSHKKAQ